MTLIGYIIALVIIIVIFWAAYYYIPATPLPMNILRWVIWAILIIVLFAMLFSVLGYDYLGFLNRRV